MITTIGLLSTDFPAEHTQERGQLICTAHSVMVEYQSAAHRPTTQVDVSACVDGAPLYRIEKALWDTGAIQSVVSERFARKMGLQPVNTGIGITASGKTEISYYMMDVYLSGNIVFRNIQVAGFPMENYDVDFLVGMDIISKGTLTIQSDGGKTVIMFKDGRQ